MQTEPCTNFENTNSAIKIRNKNFRSQTYPQNLKNQTYRQNLLTCTNKFLKQNPSKETKYKIRSTRIGKVKVSGTKENVMSGRKHKGGGNVKTMEFGRSTTTERCFGGAWTHAHRAFVSLLAIAR